jgi:anti-sigma B factor antagonist
MASSEFQAAIRHRNGAAIIDLHGEIDAAADAPLAAAYANAVADDAAAVVLNFQGVDYINSTGIALIVGLLARARTERRVVTACGLIDHYREIFEITRLSDFMQLYPDEDSAVQGMPASAR